METKFYTGNYTLPFGYPYVIISADEKENEFYAEKFIIFEGFNGQNTCLASRVKYPNVSQSTLDDFISSEIQVCKDDIFYKILFEKYKPQLEQANYNVSVELRETGRNILSIIRDKFSVIFYNIESKTTNEELKALIKVYKSVVVTRNDFDISR